MAKEANYDDTAFTYFALSVLAIVLIPTTLSFARKWQNAFTSKYTGLCKCPKCRTKAKNLQVASRKPSFGALVKFGLWALVWILFLYLLHHAATAESGTESVQFDPYQILEIGVGTPEDEIKRAYRKLSLIWHPDKNPGNPAAADRYIQIAKAYETLTDPDIREKWEKYGNPDGPQAFSVGIALPSWLVDTKNSTAVLLLYILFLVIIFPTGAIYFWNRQKELAPNQLMKKTMYLFYQALTENMRFKNIIQILAASFEYTEKMPVRRSDEEVLQQLKTMIPHVGDDPTKHKSKRKVLLPHIVKHVMLFYGHFSRLHDVMAPVAADVNTLVKGVHHLVIGMVELTVSGGRRWLTPTLEAIQTTQMVTQAIWADFARLRPDVSLLQIPYFTEQMVRKCATKKMRVFSVQDFINLEAQVRKDFLVEEGLDASQIDDIERILKEFPHDISVKYRCEVDDDDENVGITGGSIVTLVVQFTRPSKPYDKPVKKKEKESVIAKEEQPVEVHAPFFPEKKHELWWVIFGDERTNKIFGLTRLSTLRDGTETKIPFQAPFKPGTYQYTLFLLSDSYVGFDHKIGVKIQVTRETFVPPEETPDELDDQEDGIKKNKTGENEDIPFDDDENVSEEEE